MQYGDILTYLKYLQSINVRLLRSINRKRKLLENKNKNNGAIF